MRVELAGVSVAIDGVEIVADCDLVAETGSTVGLVGPNGSGKSTLLRVLYRSIRAHRGTAYIGEAEVRTLPVRELARRRAVVGQDTVVPAEYSVREIVAMGRHPHQRLFDGTRADDRRHIDAALDAVAMSWAADRSIGTLSGGERQRVMLARAIAQDTPVLLLDEPTNHLDIGAQLSILELVRKLSITTVIAIHDLDHALAYCDTVVLLRFGRVVAAGPPESVLLPDVVAEVFGVHSLVVEHPLTGRPHLLTAPLETRTLPSPVLDQEGSP